MNELTQVISPNSKTLRPFSWGFLILILANCIGAQALTSGDYTYEQVGTSTCAITAYSGSGGNITIPSSLDGYDSSIPVHSAIPD